MNLLAAMLGDPVRFTRRFDVATALLATSSTAAVIWLTAVAA